MLKVLNHPLITHKLAQMRKVETGTKDFRQNLDEIAGLMAYEICRDLPTKPVTIQTPICECQTEELSKEIVLIPILRAEHDAGRCQHGVGSDAGDRRICRRGDRHD